MWLRLAVALVWLAPAFGQQYRAYCVDAFNRGFKSPAEIEELLENAVASHANAIFMQARRRGDVYYLRSVEPPAQDTAYNPNFDALDYLIDRAHARGIEVHAWFVISRLWTSTAQPADPRHIWHTHGPNAEGAEMWMTLSSAGAMGNSLDLGHPAAARHLADVVVHSVRDYPALDGVHLDYIRYPEEADFGWNPTAVERFHRLQGREGSPGRTDPAWADFRRQQTTQLVRQIYLRANALRPSIKVSAAVITWGSGPTGADLDASYRRLDAYSRVFQDWRGWLEEGILDFAMPMHYFNEGRNAAFLDRWLAYTRDRQYRRAIMPGLGVYLNPIAASLQQITRALASSPFGVALYSYASTNESNAQRHAEFYQAVGALFGAPAAVPDLPWKSAPEQGHLLGRLEVEGGAAWLNDGVNILVESDTGGSERRVLKTDGSGFFGAVDLPPDRYKVSIEVKGEPVFRGVPRDVVAGQVTEFPLLVTADLFEEKLF